jgi:beta-1,4-mannosyltransferase
VNSRVLILVGGDLGRSPRMIAHARAAAAAGAHVDLVGYRGAPLPGRVATDARIAVHALPTRGDRTMARLRSTAYAAGASGRAFWRTGRLVRALLALPRPDVMLVQTPPAIPAVAAAVLVARLRRVPFVIDWHSFSDAVLAQRLGADAWGVQWLRVVEQRLTHGAAAHLAVSDALAAALRSRGCAASVTVAPDRPLEQLAPLSAGDRAQLFDRLVGEQILSAADASALDRRTAALLVAPTSWNGDDDFPALLEALSEYDRSPGDQLPAAIVVITGAGPLRDQFDEHLRRYRWRRVTVRTAWLAPDDYPRALAAADVGLCLHRTIAGVDPPIKLADMRGAGLPACVLDEGGAHAFAERLVELLDGFPRAAALERARAALAGAPSPTWFEAWPLTVAPVLERCVTKSL